MSVSIVAFHCNLAYTSVFPLSSSPKLSSPFFLVVLSSNSCERYLIIGNECYSFPISVNLDLWPCRDTQLFFNWDTKQLFCVRACVFQTPFFRSFSICLWAFFGTHTVCEIDFQFNAFRLSLIKQCDLQCVHQPKSAHLPYSKEV